jgi:hypothetical protein
VVEKRDIEIKAQHKGMYLEPWENDPTDPDAAMYWLVDEDTTLPANLDPLSLTQIDEMLNIIPDKSAADPRPELQYGDGTEA